ncbi:MAG: DUF5108 domain-containing protein [Bacteroidales bacterium]|nr:DUF5108 domain-containing protein [Bacteroidales bacterium]
MKRLQYLIWIFLIVSACEDPFKDQLFVTESEDVLTLTNAAYLDSRSEEFSLWIDLLNYTDLYNAINDASTQTTVFCPNNEAMEAFLAFKQVESVEQLDRTYARELVRAHILRSSLTEASFMVYVNEGQINVPTVFGMYLTTGYGQIQSDVDDAELDFVERTDTLTIYLNNQASVLEMARQTVNGMVYVLGGVVRPLSETIVQKLADYGTYTLYLEAIKATGLDSLLNVVADTTYELGGAMSINQVQYTCFAVPDSVYQANGITNLNGLAQYLNAGTHYTDSSNALYQYILYHTMDKAQEKQDLFELDSEDQVRVFDTMLKDQVFTTRSLDGSTVLNDRIRLIRSNMQARNGIIHKMDQIMPVWEPTPVTVVWDLCNSKDIISIANAYGAANSLGNLFNMPLTSKEYQVDLSEDKINGNYGTIDAFTYKEASSKTSYNSWRKVGYMKCKYLNTQNKEVNSYGANMDNLLILNLGYTGWIQFETPTLIKGKYRVELYYAGAVALSSYYSTGSLVRFTLDDYIKPLYVWKGLDLKSGSHIHGDVLFDEIEFETSTTHTLRAVMMDIKASTNSPYRQMWDYVKFIPIED